MYRRTAHPPDNQITQPPRAAGRTVQTQTLENGFPQIQRIATSKKSDASMGLENRIRKIRESYGLTQAEVAFKADISPQAYGKIERRANKAKIETLIKIAKAMGVSIKFLIDVENPKYVE